MEKDISKNPISNTKSKITLIIVIKEYKKLLQKWIDYSINIQNVNIKEIRDFIKYKVYEY